MRWGDGCDGCDGRSQKFFWGQNKMPLLQPNNLTDFIMDNDLYLIQGDKNYYMYYDHDERNWIRISKSAVHETSVVKKAQKLEAEATGGNAIGDMLNRMDRIKHGTYRGLSKRTGELNTFTPEKWLQPIYDFDEPPHPFFDILMTSLADGRQEYKDKIEQFLIHKYRFPLDVGLPALVMYGAGGVGKNTFYEICKRIFGGYATTTNPRRALAANFNTVIDGKIIVFLNDTAVDDEDTEALKAITDDNTLTIYGKYVNEVDTENMVWWFVSQNDKNGKASLPPVALKGDGGDGADRRWFILKQAHDLLYWVEQSPDYMNNFGKGRFLTPRMYVNNRANFLKHNDIAISHWLGYLLNKHSEPKLNNRPEAIYGNDYLDAVSIARTAALAKSGDEMAAIKLAKFVFESDAIQKFDVDAMFYFYSTEVGVKYNNSGTFGGFLSRYVEDNRLAETWEHSRDKQKRFWRRRTIEGSEKRHKLVMVDVNELNIDIAPLMKAFYATEVHDFKQEAFTPVDLSEILWDEQHTTRRRMRYSKIAEDTAAEKILKSLERKNKERADFKMQDYVKSVVCQDTRDFAEIISHLSNYYGYSFKKFGADSISLTNAQQKFRNNIVDRGHADEVSCELAEIWNYTVCIEWLDTRECCERDLFLKRVFTVLTSPMLTDNDSDENRDASTSNLPISHQP